MKKLLYQAMVTTVACLLVLGTSTASAFSGGFAGGGTTCMPCHGTSSGSVAPMISGLSSLLPSQTATYTASIAPNLVGAGLDIATTGGSLTATAPGTALMGVDVVHTQRNGVFSYNFDVTAPAAPGTFDLLGAMLAYNEDFSTSGDLWNTTLFQITVIPEPATLALLGLSLAGMVVMARQNRRKREHWQKE